MAGEADLERIGTGLARVAEGCFVLNAAEAAWAFPGTESVPGEVASGAEAHTPYGRSRKESVPPELPGAERQ